jgi:hypothetical protein
MVFNATFNNISVYIFIHQIEGAVLVMIVWWLDLKLPMQSVPIITNIVSSNPTQEIQHSSHLLLDNNMKNKKIQYCLNISKFISKNRKNKRNYRYA